MSLQNYWISGKSIREKKKNFLNWTIGGCYKLAWLLISRVDHSFWRDRGRIMDVKYFQNVPHDRYFFHEEKNFPDISLLPLDRVFFDQIIHYHSCWNRHNQTDTGGDFSQACRTSTIWEFNHSITNLPLPILLILYHYTSNE